jgi:type II secretory pathway pseudopilin PulG
MTTAMRQVADLRRVCYARSVHRSTLRSTLRGTAGLSIVEVLAVTVIVGIAVIGVALMFGKGSAWVSATGADRVAAGLAQQRIEQIRGCGWDVATADPLKPKDCAGLPEAPPLKTALGVLLPETDIKAGNNHTFTRTVCIQYVDPETPQGLGEPPFAPACPPGAATPMVRITVVVSSTQPETSPVTLQAWMHCLESPPAIKWVRGSRLQPDVPCPSQAAP